MKRSGLNLFILLISSVFILQSCEKSEDNTDLKSNTLSYNGVDYEVTNGKLWYYGLWTEDESVNSFEVLILSEDSKNFLRLHLLSSSNTGLSTGTYNFSDQDAAFTLTGGLFIVNYNSTNDTSDARLELNGGMCYRTRSGDLHVHNPPGADSAEGEGVPRGKGGGEDRRGGKQEP